MSALVAGRVMRARPWHPSKAYSARQTPGAGAAVVGVARATRGVAAAESEIREDKRTRVVWRRCDTELLATVWAAKPDKHGNSCVTLSARIGASHLLP